ncbi:FecR family protein [Tepidicaulis sp. LMO-SS28]|uniref:FecR family protein n=1 Tax=Tepidicaulis sp. LMO-SS28 TaxID=3447455 RepID=UPI003EE3C06B
MTRNADALMKEGMDWVIRLNSGAVTVADARAFELWRQSSHAHEMAFREAQALNGKLKTAARVYAQAQHARRAESGLMDALRSGWSNVAPARPVSVSRRGFMAGAVAASAAAWVAAEPPLGLWPSLAELGADIRTATGERRRVALQNNATLELNTRTSVELKEEPSLIRVDLISGEAAAKIDRDGRPVLLYAGGGEVRASEAEFMVRYEQKRACVTCISGHVDVAYGGRRVQLAGNRQIYYGPAGLEMPSHVDARLAAAWRQGQLIFKDTPLSEVLSEVNRYRPGRIVLANSALASLKFSGVFHLDRLDGVIAQVEAVGATVRQFPGGVVLVS